VNGLVTGPVLATILGVSAVTIWKWTSNGQIPRTCVKYFGQKRPVARYSLEHLKREGFLTDSPLLAASA
jgi:hypothetical protein